MLWKSNPGPLERRVVAVVHHSSVAEHWQLKPEALGLITGGPFFLSSPCRFKGLQTVAAPIVLFIDMITISLPTTEESRPSDASTAVISLTISHINLRTQQ